MNWQSDKNIEHEILSQKAIQKEISSRFFKINPDEQNFNILKP